LLLILGSRYWFILNFPLCPKGIHCTGAPIKDVTKRVTAAISISAPAIRLTKEKIKKLEVLLIETSLEISRKMGYVE
jgi:DNA-binding IclR family transcriptional regulator